MPLSDLHPAQIFAFVVGVVGVLGLIYLMSRAGDRRGETARVALREVARGAALLLSAGLLFCVGWFAVEGHPWLATLFFMPSTLLITWYKGSSKISWELNVGLWAIACTVLFMTFALASAVKEFAGILHRSEGGVVYQKVSKELEDSLVPAIKSGE